MDIFHIQCLESIVTARTVMVNKFAENEYKHIGPG